jgi:hypothetical protein
MAKFNDSIYNLLSETDYSATPTGVDVWTGSNPFIGSTKQFPPPALVERADISHTNNELFENNISEVFSEVINVFREVSPLTGMPIHEIICGLPHFRNVEQYWQALIAGDTPIVEHSDRDISKKLADVISKSNFSEFVATEISSRMRDVISAYTVTARADGTVHIGKIEAKNIIVFLSAEETGTVEVVLFSNIFELENPTEELPKGKYVQFIEYHSDGIVKETVCEYRNRKVGRVLSETEEQAFGGVAEIAPAVLFKHNTVGSQVYGTDQYRYMASSVAGALRSLQNLLRLGEKLRESLWYGSDKLVSKNPADGSSAFMLNGFAGIPEGIDNQITPGHVAPTVPITDAVEVFNKCIKSLSMDSKLGMVFFEIEKLGSNLSAKSITASMYPAQLEAKRVSQELTKPVLEVVRRLYLAATGELLRTEDLSITWFDGLPVDEKEFTETIQSRIGTTMTLEQAISRLDKVSSAVAFDRAEELRGNTGDAGFISVEPIETPEAEETDPTPLGVSSEISPILTNDDDGETGVSSDKPKFHEGRFTPPKLNSQGHWEWEIPGGVRIKLKGGKGKC